MRIRILSATLALCCLAEAQAIELVATGGLTRTIGSADLVSGAGSDLENTYTDAAATSLTIANSTGDSDSWRIDVRKSDTSFNAALHLKIRRDSGGSGGGTVTGGTSFIEVTDNDSQFFTGSGDRSGIVVSYQLTGMGVDIPPATYSSTVIFTVVDIP